MSQEHEYQPVPPVRWKLFGSLSVPNFRLYIAGHFISMTGVWMQSVALSWLMWNLTHSTRWLGALGFSNWILAFFFGLMGGATVDRIQRRKLILITQTLCLLQAGVLAVFVFANVVTPTLLIGLVLFTGAIYAFDFPARQGFITDIVGKDQVDNAVGLASSAFQTARVVGSTAAGLIVAYWGEGSCFAANAITYLAFIAAVILMDGSALSPQSTSDLPMYRAIREGLQIAWNNSRLRRPLILIAIISFFCMPYFILIPVFVDKVYGGGSKDYGLIMAIIAGGALLGSLAMAKSLSPRETKQKTAFSSLGMSISVITFAWMTKFWMAAVALFFSGFFTLISLATINAWLQREAPDHARGRILSLWSMMFFGFFPLGSFAAGFAAERLGAPTTLSIGGCICIIASMWFMRARTRKPVYD